MRILHLYYSSTGNTFLDEWYVVGEYVPEKMAPFSEKGRMGDIRGRPDAHDLNAVTERVKAILNV